MHYSLYWVFMRDNRIWNLAVKMTTHGLSRRCGILAPLVLRELPLITRVTHFFTQKYLFCVLFCYFCTIALLGVSENFAQFLILQMLFELRIEEKKGRDRNRVRQTDLLTGNVVLLLSERVQVLDRSNYGCLLAAGKKKTKNSHSVEK